MATVDEEFMADPFGGDGFLAHSDNMRRTWLLFDARGRVVNKCEVQRVDPIVEANRELYNDSFNERWGDGRVVASIPNAIYWSEDFQTKRQDEVWLKRFLNDPDNQKLRTFRGTI